MPSLQWVIWDSAIQCHIVVGRVYEMPKITASIAQTVAGLEWMLEVPKIACSWMFTRQAWPALALLCELIVDFNQNFPAKLFPHFRFWVHGGSFDSGSGNSWVYGPDFLVNENVVVVTINYRLGILGFLGTGDGAAQGNYGMKDMIEALRWVRTNIHHFGGNPNAVTIFGESAGSVAVSYAHVKYRWKWPEHVFF